MKLKKVIYPVMIIVLLAGTGCSVRSPQSGDTIVPPVAGKLSREDPKSSSSLNNMSNMSPLVQPSANMVYTLLDKAVAPLSIFADNKYLYLLRNTGKTGDAADSSNSAIDKYGDVIEVYDVENGSLVRKISHKSIGRCSAFTVKDSNLYAFDINTGRISLFSSGGSFLSSYDTGLSGVYADKIAIADNRRIVLKIRENDGENAKIAVYDPDANSVSKFKAYQLCISSSSGIPEISDFCLLGDKSILVGLSYGMLSCFNIEKGAVEKSCAFPMTAGFMEFDGNVLYYANDEPVTLSPGNAANFSNVSSRRQTGRMLINSEFNWPRSEQELDAWLLNGLQMTVADDKGRHYGMARSTKYLFFLDLLPAVMGGNKNGEPNFMVYRIMK